MHPVAGVESQLLMDDDDCSPLDPEALAADVAKQLPVKVQQSLGHLDHERNLGRFLRQRFDVPDLVSQQHQPNHHHIDN